MRKILSILLSILLVFSLSSCKKNAKKEETIKSNYPFTCTVNMQYDTLNAKGNLTIYGKGSAKLVFTEPSALNSLEFSLNKDEICAKYNGLSFSFTDIDGTHVFPAKMLFSAITDALSKPHKIFSGEKNHIIKSSIKGTQYELEFDRKSGRLISMSLPSESLNIDFTDFKILS